MEDGVFTKLNEEVVEMQALIQEKLEGGGTEGLGTLNATLDVSEGGINAPAGMTQDQMKKFIKLEKQVKLAIEAAETLKKVTFPQEIKKIKQIISDQNVTIK